MRKSYPLNSLVAAKAQAMFPQFKPVLPTPLQSLVSAAYGAHRFQPQSLFLMDHFLAI